MSTNNRISDLVSTQLPDFVRSDHPNFVAFLEAYYEYLEQSNSTIQFGKTVERTKNMLNYLDIDTTIDGFAQKFYDQFLGLIPKDVTVDKTFILKNVKDFYRARGTEKSFRFLFRALFNEEPEFYYPKNDILIASSGRWFIEKSLRITNMTGGDSLASLKQFQSLRIRGSSSGATAIVERVAVSFELPVGQLYELFLSNIVLGNGPLEEDSLRPFENGEQITAIDLDGNTLTATILSGRLERLTINQSGTGYSVGDPLVFTGDGSGAAAIVSKVSTGNVANVAVIDGGIGFRAGDPILFTGGGGSGANAIVFTVANTANYNINSDIINTYNATVISAYSNGSGGDITTPLANTWSTEVMTLGEIAAVVVLNPGDGYSSVPFAEPVGNTRIKTLGILGDLNIADGGTGYANGELLVFTNIPNGYGFGANGRVTVNATGTIVEATLTPLSGFIKGGVGYNPNFLPSISVNTVGGSGANIVVSEMLAYGSPFTEPELAARTTELGRVEALAITARGANYTTPPSITITTSTGDGNANVTATVSTGAFTYPGRFLDDTGFPSGFNYLQDRDYYQNYSYVVRVRESIEKYRLYLKNILAPAGFKLWGDYVLDETEPLELSVSMANSVVSTFNTFTVNAVAFSDSYLYKTTPLANANSSLEGTFSVWINPSRTPATNTEKSYIYFGGNTNSSVRFAVSLANNDSVYVQIEGKDNDGNEVLLLKTKPSTPIVKNNWIHIISSWDLSNTSRRHIYVTNVASMNVVTFINANVTHNVTNTGVAATTAGADLYYGSMAELWYDDNYVDVSNVTNRQKFITTGLLPVNLGANGSTPTGNRPIQYLRFASTDFANSAADINSNLVISGTITGTNNTPSSI